MLPLECFGLQGFVVEEQAIRLYGLATVTSLINAVLSLTDCIHKEMLLKKHKLFGYVFRNANPIAGESSIPIILRL